MTARRGTSNANVRGNTRDRESRRRYLVEVYRSDVDVSIARRTDGSVFDVQPYNPRLDSCGYDRAPACRCYRCGKLLSVETVTVDRIIPGCQGGTYRRDNIRPACGECNSVTGGALRRGGRRDPGS